jgi:hypothetical protein
VALIAHPQHLAYRTQLAALLAFLVADAPVQHACEIECHADRFRINVRLCVGRRFQLGRGLFRLNDFIIDAQLDNSAENHGLPILQRLAIKRRQDGNHAIREWRAALGDSRSDLQRPMCRLLGVDQMEAVDRMSRLQRAVYQPFDAIAIRIDGFLGHSAFALVVGPDNVGNAGS